MRRLALFPLLILVAGGCNFLERRNFSFFEESPAYHAVPLDVPLFFEISSFNSVSTDHPVLEGLRENNLWRPLFTLMEKFDSLVSNMPEIPSSLFNDKIIIALKSEGRDEITPLYIVPVSSPSRKNAWSLLIDIWFPDESHAGEKRNYDHVRLTDISDASHRRVFTFAFTGGLLLASPKSVLVEQAIRQLNDRGISENPGFVKVNRTAARQVIAALYVNHQFLPGFIAKWLNNQSYTFQNEFGETEVLRYSREMHIAAMYAGWSEFDISVTDQGFLLSGVTSAYDSLNQYLALFHKQQPLRFQADKLLPSNTAYFVSYTLSDPGAFFRELENHFKSTNLFYKREEKFRRMSMECRTDVKAMFQNIMDNEIILAHTTIPADSRKKSGVVVIPVKNRVAAEGQLLQILQTHASRRGQNPDDLSVILDTENDFYAYTFPYPSLLSLWLGNPFKSVQANFICFWQNNLIMASTREEMASYLKKMSAGERLSGNRDYQRFMQRADNKANINFYADLSLSYSMAGEVFNREFLKIMEQSPNNMHRFRYVNWQVVQSREVFYNNLCISFSKDKEENVVSGGRMAAGGNLSGKPQPIILPFK